jgi:hypothetical protein
MLADQEFKSGPANAETWVLPPHDFCYETEPILERGNAEGEEV